MIAKTKTRSREELESRRPLLVAVGDLRGDASPSPGPPPPGRDPGRPGPGPRQIAERMRERRGERRTLLRREVEGRGRPRSRSGSSPCEGAAAREAAVQGGAVPTGRPRARDRTEPSRASRRTRADCRSGTQRSASRQPRASHDCALLDAVDRRRPPPRAPAGSAWARADRAAIAAASRWCRSRSVATPTTGPISASADVEPGRLDRVDHETAAADRDRGRGPLDPLGRVRDPRKGAGVVERVPG